MAATMPMSVRLKKSTKDRLCRLTEATNSRQAVPAAEALERFVELNEWQIAESQMALANADASGPIVAHEDIAPWLNS